MTGKNQYPEWTGKQKRHNRIYDVLSIRNAELLSTVWKASWPVNELVCQAAAKECWQKELAAWLNWCGTKLGGEQQELLCACLQSPAAGAVLGESLQHRNGKCLRGACLLLPLQSWGSIMDQGAFTNVAWVGLLYFRKCRMLRNYQKHLLSEQFIFKNQEAIFFWMLSLPS